MKIIFLVPRFHTNLNPIVKVLAKNNNDLEIFTQSQGFLEDYSLLKPRLIQQSLLSTIAFSILKLFSNKSQKENLKVKVFLTTEKWIKENILPLNPDLIVFRDRSIFSLQLTMICKKFKFKNFVIYNQSPLNDFTKNPLKIFWRSFFPYPRFTPVNNSSFNINQINNSYFLPFFSDHVPNTNKEIYEPLCLNVLSVAKYRSSKNIILLIHAIANINKKILRNTHFTIIGQCKFPFEIKYFNKLKYISKLLDISDKITFLTNVPSNEMPNFYIKSNIFVLPSKNELASISILEAMTYGLPVISTDRNGTANYIEFPNKCGEKFFSNDLKSLTLKLEDLLSNQEKRLLYKKNSLTNVKDFYNSKNWYNKFIELVSKNYPLLIK